MDSAVAVHSLIKMGRLNFPGTSEAPGTSVVYVGVFLVMLLKKLTLQTKCVGKNSDILY